jgi:hypothetical protein
MCVAVADCAVYLLLQASLPEHLVIESKPDSQVDDLRCVCMCVPLLLLNAQ